MRLRGALAAFALCSTAAAVCIDPFGALCISWGPSGGNITFEIACAPPPGSSNVTWCGFGFSNQTTSTMFPASITAVQLLDSTDGEVVLEDRYAFQGYQLPPCYSTQLTELISGRRGPDGTLVASWTRPQQLPSELIAQGYLDLSGGVNLTLIGASSSDGAYATATCADYMTPHSLVQPGVGPFSFPVVSEGLRRSPALRL